MVTFIYEYPPAVASSMYGEALGYYVDCDSAVCRDCAPPEFATGDYSQWLGFEGWETPIAIFNDAESDSPTHCRHCEALLHHSLTFEGMAYIQELITDFVLDKSSHNPDLVAYYWDAYGEDMDASDMRDIIELALASNGARVYYPKGGD